jgi:hypothetical protein
MSNYLITEHIYSLKIPFNNYCTHSPVYSCSLTDLFFFLLMGLYKVLGRTNVMYQFNNIRASMTVACFAVPIAVSSEGISVIVCIPTRKRSSFIKGDILSVDLKVVIPGRKGRGEVSK